MNTTKIDLEHLSQQLAITTTFDEPIKTPCWVIISAPVAEIISSDGSDYGAFNFNGCTNTDYNAIKNISSEDLLARIHSGGDLVFKFNEPDRKLYVTNRFITKGSLTEEELKLLFKAAKTTWVEFDITQPMVLQSPDETIEYRLKIGTDVEEKEYFTGHIPVEIPEGLHWLGAIFDTPEKMMMYEDFMECPIMFRRFKRYLHMKKIPIPAEADCSSMLPIHTKDKSTGEILISTNTLHIFEQYQFCQNFLNTKEFDLESAEHMIGKLMILYPKFCTYIQEVSKAAQEGGTVKFDEAEYDKQVVKAMKYIEQDTELAEFYDNYWKNQQQ